MNTKAIKISINEDFEDYLVISYETFVQTYYRMALKAKSLAPRFNFVQIEIEGDSLNISYNQNNAGIQLKIIVASVRLDTEYEVFCESKKALSMDLEAATADELNKLVDEQLGEVTKKSILFTCSALQKIPDSALDPSVKQINFSDYDYVKDNFVAVRINRNEINIQNNVFYETENGTCYTAKVELKDAYGKVFGHVQISNQMAEKYREEFGITTEQLIKDAIERTEKIYPGRLDNE